MNSYDEPDAIRTMDTNSVLTNTFFRMFLGLLASVVAAVYAYYSGIWETMVLIPMQKPKESLQNWTGFLPVWYCCTIFMVTTVIWICSFLTSGRNRRSSFGRSMTAGHLLRIVHISHLQNVAIGRMVATTAPKENR